MTQIRNIKQLQSILNKNRLQVQSIVSELNRFGIDIDDHGRYFFLFYMNDNYITKKARKLDSGWFVESDFSWNFRSKLGLSIAIIQEECNDNFDIREIENICDFFDIEKLTHKEINAIGSYFL